MKRIALFIAGLGFSYATYKFGILTYTLLAAGQFFTPILAAMFAATLAVFGIIFLVEALDQ